MYTCMHSNQTADLSHFGIQLSLGRNGTPITLATCNGALGLLSHSCLGQELRKPERTQL
jgi:hypothetical protein